MQNKKAIQEKAKEAQILYNDTEGEEKNRLEGVLVTLHWVLETKIITKPKDPVSNETIA